VVEGVPASVLLALAPVEGADDLELVLVERPGHLRQHAGQVGLPGGAVEPTDADGVAAALREAQEEVGLDPSAVRVLGSLDRAYLAVSDFDVLPVVGVWDGLAPLTPSPDEVAAILRPTLRQLADPANHGAMTFGAILGEEEMAARGVPGGLPAAAAAALAELEARSGTVLVHFDVDVVDSGDLPLANFPHFGQGLSLTDAFACLEAFLASPKLGGLVVTEVNPDHDPGGQLGRLVDGLVAALAQQGPRSPPLPTIRS